jgi:hypothetical protein
MLLGHDPAGALGRGRDPGRGRARFAASVPELDAYERAEAVDKVDGSLCGRDLVVGPETEVFGTDTTFGNDRPVNR